MTAQKISGLILLFLGVVGLVIGLFGLFGDSLTKQNPWIFSILGILFFIAGINLLKGVDRN